MSNMFNKIHKMNHINCFIFMLENSTMTLDFSKHRVNQKFYILLTFIFISINKFTTSYSYIKFYKKIIGNKKRNNFIVSKNFKTTFSSTTV